MTDSSNSGRGWKVAAIVALVAFEFTRELYVTENVAPRVAALYDFSWLPQYGIFTGAGTWRRIGDGDRLQAVALRIRCVRSEGKCTVASTNLSDMYVTAPELDVSEAKFGNDSIALFDDTPVCVTISTRIDFAQRTVRTMRAKKQGPLPPICANLEDRLESELVSSLDVKPPDSLAGHFVPFLALLKAVFAAPKK